jgi:trk system potassium uptake protein TrkH
VDLHHGDAARASRDLSNPGVAVALFLAALMHFPAVQRILGVLVALFSLSVLPPIAVSLFYADGEWHVFLLAFVVLVLVGFAVWWPVRNQRGELRLRDGFLVVALFWVVLSIAGAVPLFLSSQPVVSVTDAVFESVSGLTTTGATVLTGLDSLPRSILYYRQQLQWLGGIGIVVLAVALLPMLGVGGMQLYRAETPGPSKESNKITPRIAQTAKALWVIYLGLTVACALAYWAAGMTPFDAIAHSFSTVSTAGFSTHDASLAHFDNRAIEGVAIVFMFIGGVNFALHFSAWRRLHLRNYFADEEFRTFVSGLAVLVISTWLYLWASGYYASADEAFLKGFFQVMSAHTTSGFTTADYSLWPGLLPVLLLFTSFIGGCANSTSGGMKVIRWLLIGKQGAREVRRLIHPSAEFPVRVGNRPVPWRVVDAVWGFFAVYVVVYVVMMMMLLAAGHDQVTAFSAIAGTLNNLGPGLGAVSSSFGALDDASKWVCIVAMLLGRLEIFTLLVLVTPGFWRR